VEPARHFLLLVDGTGLNAGQTKGIQCYSNVYNLNISIETHNSDNEANIAFYFNGVASNRSSSVGNKASGIGLDDLIQQVYINISSNFNGGESGGISDKLYLFGFSRGAFVVQTICRLIDEYGLLYPSCIKYFNDMYRNWLGLDTNLDSVAFRNENCWRNVKVEFVGLFDSVFGIYKDGPDSLQLKPAMDKNQSLPASVKCAAHILSIDESRSVFSPYPWRGISHPQQELL
jgi:uncharacterized protein (DUF2235 family)